jgi:hypothetical protein
MTFLNLFDVKDTNFELVTFCVKVALGAQTHADRNRGSCVGMKFADHYPRLRSWRAPAAEVLLAASPDDCCAMMARGVA